MIGRPEHVFIALAATLLGLGTARADEVDVLLRQLVRPAPDEVPFVEVRFSPLLEAPVVASGKLEYLAPGRLARHVVDPFREDTLIDGDEVVLSREGERERRFSLRRAPELRGLLSSFSAILSGDAAALREAFDLSLAPGAASGSWTLRLSPRDEGLRRRLGDIAVSGSEGTVSCISMGAQPDAASITILGRLRGELPVPLTPGALRSLCDAVP